MMVQETTTEEVKIETEMSKEDALATEFRMATTVLEDLSRKVSREGLRRVFQAAVTFPFLTEHVRKFNNEMETELFTVCLRIEEMRKQLNVYLKEAQDAQQQKEASNG